MEENKRWADVYYTTVGGQSLPVKISDNGDVIIPERIIYTRGYPRKQKEKKASLGKSPNGYLRCMAGHVHRLVAESFIEKPESDISLVVNHIDGNKENNHYTNLEWVTQKENCIHYYTSEKAIGVRNYAVVATDMDDEYVGCYPSQAKAARELGLHKSAVTYVLKGKTKSTGGYKFRRITKEEYNACKEEQE